MPSRRHAHRLPVNHQGSHNEYTTHVNRTYSATLQPQQHPSPTPQNLKFLPNPHIPQPNPAELLPRSTPISPVLSLTNTPVWQPIRKNFPHCPSNPIDITSATCDCCQYDYYSPHRLPDPSKPSGQNAGCHDAMPRQLGRPTDSACRQIAGRGASVLSIRYHRDS